MNSRYRCRQEQVAQLCISAHEWIYYVDRRDSWNFLFQEQSLLGPTIYSQLPIAVECYVFEWGNKFIFICWIYCLRLFRFAQFFSVTFANHLLRANSYELWVPSNAPLLTLIWFQHRRGRQRQNAVTIFAAPVGIHQLRKCLAQSIQFE